MPMPGSSVCLCVVVVVGEFREGCEWEGMPGREAGWRECQWAWKPALFGQQQHDITAERGAGHADMT